MNLFDEVVLDSLVDLGYELWGLSVFECLKTGIVKGTDIDAVDFLFLRRSFGSEPVGLTGSNHFTGLSLLSLRVSLKASLLTSRAIFMAKARMLSRSSWLWDIVLR